MRRALLLLSTTTLLLLMLAGGVALAVNQINCGLASQDPLTPQCFGTDQDDQIEGRNARDIIYAYDGHDEVNAKYGDDDVYGGAGTDGLDGSGDDDKLYGGANADTLIDQGPSVDTDELRGNGGNDVLSAYDLNFTDTLICGPGDNDTAYFDRNNNLGLRDTVDASCENKVANRPVK